MFSEFTFFCLKISLTVFGSGTGASYLATGIDFGGSIKPELGSEVPGVGVGTVVFI
jgi:hypothetical protein